MKRRFVVIVIFGGCQRDYETNSKEGVKYLVKHMKNTRLIIAEVGICQ